MKLLLAIVAVAMLAGCASLIDIPKPEQPKVAVRSIVNEFDTMPAPSTGKVVVAVYGFADKTGQRKPSERLANISYAVTQGAETWVIKALKEVGGGTWFQVVERVGLDNLAKERQIIRQARQSVGDTNELPPMLFAGIIIEGGITGYDSNVLTGGAGIRYLGVGPYTEYRQDVVTISMRAISVQTGEVLLTSNITKTIISTGSNVSVFKFYDMSTQALELELGSTVNEPVNYAVRSAIEAAVVELIKNGARKQLWAFQKKKIIEGE